MQNCSKLLVLKFSNPKMSKRAKYFCSWRPDFACWLRIAFNLLTIHSNRLPKRARANESRLESHSFFTKGLIIFYFPTTRSLKSRVLDSCSFETWAKLAILSIRRGSFIPHGSLSVYCCSSNSKLPKIKHIANIFFIAITLEWVKLFFNKQSTTS